MIMGADQAAAPAAALALISVRRSMPLRPESSLATNAAQPVRHAINFLPTNSRVRGQLLGMQCTGRYRRCERIALSAARRLGQLVEAWRAGWPRSRRRPPRASAVSRFRRDQVAAGVVVPAAIAGEPGSLTEAIAKYTATWVVVDDISRVPCGLDDLATTS